jgi:hypothetical protein
MKTCSRNPNLTFVHQAFLSILSYNFTHDARQDPADLSTSADGRLDLPNADRSDEDRPRKRLRLSSDEHSSGPATQKKRLRCQLNFLLRAQDNFEIQGLGKMDM